jgi:hypothetical protein
VFDALNPGSEVILKGNACFGVRDAGWVCMRRLGRTTGSDTPDRRNNGVPVSDDDRILASLSEAE